MLLKRECIKVLIIARISSFIVLLLLFFRGKIDPVMIPTIVLGHKYDVLELMDTFKIFNKIFKLEKIENECQEFYDIIAILMVFLYFILQ